MAYHQQNLSEKPEEYGGGGGGWELTLEGLPKFAKGYI